MKKNNPSIYWVNLLTTFLSQASSGIMILVLTPVLQSQFSTAEFSNYGVMLSIIVFSTAFDFGLNMGMIRRLIQAPQQASALISSVFFFYAGLWVLFCPLFYGINKAGLAHTGDYPFFQAALTATLVFQNMVAMLFDVVLQSVNKIFVGKVIRIAKTTLELFLLLYVSKTGSALALLTASGALNCFFIMALFLYAKKAKAFGLSARAFNWSLLKSHVQYSFWYFLNAVGLVIVFNSQIILLNNWSTKADVALYIMVSRFLEMVRFGATNFTTILFPSLAAKDILGEWQELRKTYGKVLKRVVAMVLVLTLLLLTLGHTIFVYWSGQTGSQAEQLFVVLTLFTMCIVIDNVSAVFLHALRWNKIQTILAIGQGLVAMVLSYFLLQTWGIVGFAMGTLLIFLVTNFWFNPLYLLQQFKKRGSSLQPPLQG